MFELQNEFYFKKYSFIEGLYIMGSRVEGDFYRLGNYSDLDCCVLVSQPLDYMKLYKIVCSPLPQDFKIELCPRTILQLETKNKFNFDLKYLSKAIYIKDEDLRKKIPEIKVSDFREHDLNNALFISIEFFLLSLFNYFNGETSRQSIVYLEKSFRKISLHINLQHKLYPIKKNCSKNNRLFELYRTHGKVLHPISTLRKNMDWDQIDIEKSYKSLLNIITSELMNLMDDNCYYHNINELPKILVDPELQFFASSVLNIFLSLSKKNCIFPSQTIFFADSQMIKEKFIQEYSHLINYEGNKGFSPPKIIDGAYHVFK